MALTQAIICNAAIAPLAASQAPSPPWRCVWQGSAQKVRSELASLRQQLAAVTADLQRLQAEHQDRSAEQVLLASPAERPCPAPVREQPQLIADPTLTEAGMFQRVINTLTERHTCSYAYLTAHSTSAQQA